MIIAVGHGKGLVASDSVQLLVGNLATNERIKKMNKQPPRLPNAEPVSKTEPSRV